jgi:SAM-dependent methyltransferase
MDLRDLQRHWDAFGRLDPFWAILTDPARRGNGWDPERFFATGREEIGAHLQEAARLGVPRARGRALDFGCGAGRLTQALADHFDETVGVDVAPSMVALARRHNRHDARCTYVVNGAPDLGVLGDTRFDLIYTGRVLQHIEPRYAAAYITEFVRLLAPGGYLSFDVPSEHGLFVEAPAGALPVAAMRAAITAPAGPVLASPGAAIAVDVTVRNDSAVAWSDTPDQPLNVAAHWVGADGTTVVFDGPRAKLPVPLAPGASVPVRVPAMAPEAPGRYALQIDVVQEGVAWFAWHGSPVAELTAVGGPVGPTPSPPHGTSATPGAEDGFEPVMEMHALPRAEVEALLAAAGARLLAVRRVHHCGPTWLAFRYDVTR